MKFNRMTLCLLVIFLFLDQVVQAQTIAWVEGTDVVPPTAWSISPSDPVSADVISFSGPLDRSYGNRCFAESIFGGAPQLSIDTVHKIVEITFPGPAPTLCTTAFYPVLGLQGDFGPLDPGQWTFTCNHSRASFQIAFTVTGQNTLYVDADAPGFSSNGSSWLQAYTTLQDALASAHAGDRILVADGRYQPDQGTGYTTGDRQASFTIPSGVILMGGYEGYGSNQPDNRNWQDFPTILSGDLLHNDTPDHLTRQDNSYHVVTADNIIGSILDGFVIQQGQAEGTQGFRYGGGLYIASSICSVLHCIIKDNTAFFGGAVAIDDSVLNMINCHIDDNIGEIFGGAFYNEEGILDLTNCLITGNAAGVADQLGGSVMFSVNTNITCTNCTIVDNEAPSGMAISKFPFTTDIQQGVTIYNSIVRNGGNEISGYLPSYLDVSYSNIQGHTGGTGNIDVDPNFVGSDDYRLQTGSPGIDAGDQTLLPLDLLDLDQDTDINEPVPVDLNGNLRIRGGQIDQGAYEIEEPNIVQDWQLWCTEEIYYTVSQSPWPFLIVLQQGPVSISLDSAIPYSAEVKLEINATSDGGGDWTAWFDPEPGTVNAGIITLNDLYIRGEGFNENALTPGQRIKVSELLVFIRPLVVNP